MDMTVDIITYEKELAKTDITEKKLPFGNKLYSMDPPEYYYKGRKLFHRLTPDYYRKRKIFRRTYNMIVLTVDWDILRDLEISVNSPSEDREVNLLLQFLGELYDRADRFAVACCPEDEVIGRIEYPENVSGFYEGISGCLKWGAPCEGVMFVKNMKTQL